MTRSAPARYALAVSTVGVAFALVAVLWPALGQSPTLFFLLAVTLSAWYGGLGPGLVSTGLSLVVITPYLVRLGPAGLVRLAMFTAIALLVSALTATRARSRAALQRAHDELEQRSAAVERQRERLAALVDVTQRLTRGLELPVVLDTIAEAAATVLGGEAAFRLVEGEYLVRMGATPGAKAAMPRHRLRIGESLSGREARRGRRRPRDGPDPPAPRLQPPADPPAPHAGPQRRRRRHARDARAPDRRAHRAGHGVGRDARPCEGRPRPARAGHHEPRRQRPGRDAGRRPAHPSDGGRDPRRGGRRRPAGPPPRSVRAAVRERHGDGHGRGDAGAALRALLHHERAGQGHGARVHDGVLARGVAFLKKPVSADELARKVREVLDTA